MDEPKQATKSAEPETIEDKTKRAAPSIAPSDTTAPVVATSILDQAAGPTQDNFHTYTASTDTCETVKAAVELITKLKAQIPAVSILPAPDCLLRLLCSFKICFCLIHLPSTPI
jgi:hypothetical protein